MLSANMAMAYLLTVNACPGTWPQTPDAHAPPEVTDPHAILTM